MNPLWKLRLFAKWLVKRLRLAGIVGLIEYCDDCGIRQPLVWYADDALWLAVTGSTGGVLCPRCFDRRACAGLARPLSGRTRGLIRWAPTLELFEEE